MADVKKSNGKKQQQANRRDQVDLVVTTLQLL